MSKGALVLRSGQVHLTVGILQDVAPLRSADEPAEHLEVSRVETIPQVAVAADLEVGQVAYLPLSKPVSILETSGKADGSLDGKSYQELRTMAAEQGKNPGQNPSRGDLLFCLEDRQPVRIGIMEIHRNLSGEAAEAARDKLSNQVGKLKKKSSVAADYKTIPDPASPLESVQDVADKHDVHWRTVHRYVEQLDVARNSS